MSYYNYTFYPLKVSSETLREKQYEEDNIIFTENDNGFDKLKSFVGQGLVSETCSGVEAVFLVQTKYSSDMLRPYQLNWSLNEKVWYGDANCFIPVMEMEHHIDWSQVEDIEVMELALKRYTDGVREFGNKLMVIPL